MHCAMRYKLLQCSGVEPSSVPTAWQCTLRWDARSACLAYALRALRCMQASQCIVTHHGSIRDVLHACACVGTMHTQACMHATHTRAHVCTRMQMHAKIVRNIMDFSLFSRNTLPPTKYRNPKTEHRIEIFLNISDYM